MRGAVWRLFSEDLQLESLASWVSEVGVPSGGHAVRGGTASVGSRRERRGGGVGTGRVSHQEGRRPEATPDPDTGDRETDASSAHHAPEAGPSPVSFSISPPLPLHTHTRTRSWVACLLQRGQEAHQHWGCWAMTLPGSVPVADSSQRASAHPCSSSTPAALPAQPPTPGPPPAPPNPAWFLEIQQGEVG